MTARVGKMQPPSVHGEQGEGIVYAPGNRGLS